MTLCLPLGSSRFRGTDVQSGSSLGGAGGGLGGTPPVWVSEQPQGTEGGGRGRDVAVTSLCPPHAELLS